MTRVMPVTEAVSVMQSAVNEHSKTRKLSVAVEDCEICVGQQQVGSEVWPYYYDEDVYSPGKCVLVTDETTNYVILSIMELVTEDNEFLFSQNEIIFCDEGAELFKAPDETVSNIEDQFVSVVGRQYFHSYKK